MPPKRIPLIKFPDRKAALSSTSKGIAIHYPQVFLGPSSKIWHSWVWNAPAAIWYPLIRYPKENCLETRSYSVSNIFRKIVHPLSIMQLPARLVFNIVPNRCFALANNLQSLLVNLHLRLGPPIKAATLLELRQARHSSQWEEVPLNNLRGASFPRRR